MTSLADATADERFHAVDANFSERVAAVPDDAWSAPAPCEDWVARDVVRHVVEWIPGYLAGIGLPLEPGPSVDDDPVAAWRAVADQVQAVLDDPESAERVIDAPPFGPTPVAELVDRLVTGDLLVHTWDLSRATGQDESIDESMAAQMLARMEPMDDMIRGEHFGPRVEVPDDADAVTRLIAFTGRQP